MTITDIFVDVSSGSGQVLYGFLSELGYFERAFIIFLIYITINF